MNNTVTRIEFAPMTEARKLDISSGEIITVGEPKKSTLKSGQEDILDFPKKGLYCEEIFGISNDSKQGKSRGYVPGFSDRMKRFGHIVLNVPYVNPDIYKSGTTSILSKLIGLRSGVTRSIVEWDTILVRVKDGSPSLQILQELSGDSVTQDASQVPNVSAHIIKSGKMGYKYWTVPKSILSRLKNTEHSSYSTLDKWNSLDGADIFMGPYAILHLLQNFNKVEELKLTRLTIEDNRKKLLLQGKDAVTDSARKQIMAKLNDLNTKYQIITNYAERNITWDAIVSNILLVMPAGLRDVYIGTNSKGEKEKIKGEVNKYYVDIINKNNNSTLSRFKSPSLKVVNILNNPSNVNWMKEIIYDNNSIDNAKQIQEQINKISQEVISDKIGKKYGRLRQGVFSKRADYTGRAVITPDPTLKMNEMALPIAILRQWFKSILQKGTDSESKITKNAIDEFLKNTTQSYDLEIDVDNEEDLSKLKVIFKEFEGSKLSQIAVIEELERKLSEMRVLAIRYPTLHKYNAMGFKIKISYDNTIHLHPLVCTPYNADFDGDNMSLFLIQLPESVKEVDEVLLPSKNMVSTSGHQLITPTQDAVLGLHYMTILSDNLDKSPKDDIPIFHSYQEMLRAYQFGRVGLNDTVEVLSPHYTESVYESEYFHYRNTSEAISNKKVYEGETYAEIIASLKDDTNKTKALRMVNIAQEYDEPAPNKHPMKYVKSTVGRFLFNELIPQDLGYVDRSSDPYKLETDGIIENDKKGMHGLIADSLEDMLVKIVAIKHEEEVLYILDRIKEEGYKHVTEIGISISLQDIHSHPDKPEIINEAQKRTEEILQQEKEGKITREEAYRLNIENWQSADDLLTNKTLGALSEDNTIKMMADSGSRGNRNQLSQLMGMRGLMSDTEGNTIETPIVSSFEDGLSQAEFFIASYGTRKGTFDTASRTKDTGDLTRTAVYGTEQIIVSLGDCGDTQGIQMTDLREVIGAEEVPIMRTVTSPTGETIEEQIGVKLIPQYKIYTKEDGDDYKEKNKQESKKSLSKRIVGKFALENILGKDGEVLVEKGQPIMKQYPEIDEVYEGKSIKVRSPISCKHHVGICAKCYGFNYGKNRFAMIGDGVGISASQTIGERGTQLTMRTFHTGGVAKDGDVNQGFGAVQKLLTTKSYPKELSERIELLSKPSEDQVNETNKITTERLTKYVLNNNDGTKQDLTFDSYGIVNGEEYIGVLMMIKDRIQFAYQSQGIDISDVHYEVIARAMGSELSVIEQGDSVYTPYSRIEWSEVKTINEKFLAEGHKPVLVVPYLRSLKSVASSASKPLTALSFQDPNKNIARSITTHGIDNLTNSLSAVAVSNPLATGETAKYAIQRSEKALANPITKQEQMEKISKAKDIPKLEMPIEEKPVVETPKPTLSSITQASERKPTKEKNLEWALNELDKSIQIDELPNITNDINPITEKDLDVNENDVFSNNIEDSSLTNLNWKADNENVNTIINQQEDNQEEKEEDNIDFGDIDWGL